ncbi:MAG TPA: carbohydrate kinase family protein [Gaiella sp.]|uniref:carbohydrate kinase family protein n=1 Tax=Gaiella sp. TaxID=2663207 RepID=UPI002D808ADD|nr:carbohydrate kinase family protein [Gaiella sp.]HET9289266.1 carbohydrate kinase family protein [Gaiella sp.]
MSTIATIGNLAVDRIAGAPPRAGGGVFHAARAAAHVRADAVAVTRCAPGDRATALAPLESLGLPVTCADATETTAFSFHYEGDHRVMAVDAVGEPWTPEDVEGWASAALDGAGWVLVAGLLRSHFPAPTIEALARGGRRLLLDAQGLVRLARTGPLTRDGAFDREALRHLAVLKLNEDEGRILAGDLEPRALRALGVPEIVLTLGSQGALVVTSEGATRVDAQTVSGTVDPTGAGDAFSLVYVDGRAQGLGPVAAAERAANAVAELISVR